MQSGANIKWLWFRLVVSSVMHTVGWKAGVNDCYSYVCEVAYQPETAESIAQLMSSYNQYTTLNRNPVGANHAINSI